MSPGKFRNTLLQHLDNDVINRLELQPVTLDIRHMLEIAGAELKNLIFIEEGVASTTLMFIDGSEVEVSMFGREAVIGVSSLMGARVAPANTFMQGSGSGLCTTRELALKEFARCEQFHDLILRYVQALLAQTAQSAGCNARHTLHQRLARWLLLCRDRSDSDTLDLTQEFLAVMLGVERPTVSLTAARLQDQHLIEYHRGRIRILNRIGLQKASCECYGVIRDSMNSYLPQQPTV